MSRLFNPRLTPPRQVWLENFIGGERKLLNILELHPRVFGVFPRIDYISEVIKWQQTYRNISYLSMPTRNEFDDAHIKPWPQKGQGRARHGSIRSPIWNMGGWAHGPRGPTTSFHLKAMHKIINGLRSMLTVKLAQNDLKVVDTIQDYVSENPEELESDLEKRDWGPSVLIVDKDDNFPESLINSSQALNHVNLMPVVSLNPLSMAKHETLVVTQEAIKQIEEKLLFQLLRVDLTNTRDSYREPKATDYI